MEKKTLDQRRKTFVILVITIIIAIAITVVVSILLLDNKGKINQGNFRVQDCIVTSTVSYVDSPVQNTENPDESSIHLAITQKNELEFLIAHETTYTRAYLQNISVKGPKKRGNVTLTQAGDETVTDLNTNLKEVTIYPQERDDGQYYIGLTFSNNNFATDVPLPSQLDSVIFDGTLLEPLNISHDSIQMEVKFELCLVDTTGKTSICKIKMQLPEESITKNGTVILREDPKNFPFILK